MTQTAVILMTSQGVLGGTGKPTGFHWVEMATPYYALKDAGFNVTFASVIGGRPPSDPSSSDPETREADVSRFFADTDAMDQLERSVPVARLDPDAYDVVYIPGGHGTMWDLAQTETVGRFVARAYEGGAVIGSVCHGPAALTESYLRDGSPLVKGKRINAFTDSEESAVGLDDVVPFLLESRLRERGALFEGNAENFGSHVARDTRLVTGQNPASVPEVARALIEVSGAVGKAA